MGIGDRHRRNLTETISLQLTVHRMNNFTQRALEVYFHHSGDRENASSFGGTMAGHEATRAPGLPTLTSAKWWSVFAFLDRAWFSKVWLVQELVSQPRGRFWGNNWYFPG